MLRFDVIGFLGTVFINKMVFVCFGCARIVRSFVRSFACIRSFIHSFALLIICICGAHTSYFDSLYVLTLKQKKNVMIQKNYSMHLHTCIPHQNEIEIESVRYAHNK